MKFLITDERPGSELLLEILGLVVGTLAPSGERVLVCKLNLRPLRAPDYEHMLCTFYKLVSHTVSSRSMTKQPETSACGFYPIKWFNDITPWDREMIDPIMESMVSAYKIAKLGGWLPPIPECLWLQGELEASRVLADEAPMAPGGRDDAEHDSLVDQLMDEESASNERSGETAE